MSEAGSSSSGKITLFTIGFAGKSAEEFFAKLRDAGVRKVIDARLNNRSQLAGFTKHPDIQFFLTAIASIGYEHSLDLAPTKELLDDYRKKAIAWPEYEARFIQLMTDRQVETKYAPQLLDGCCLLCSEPTPGKCHRRLVAEYFHSKWQAVEVRHL